MAQEETPSVAMFAISGPVDGQEAVPSVAMFAIVDDEPVPRRPIGIAIHYTTLGCGRPVPVL